MVSNINDKVACDMYIKDLITREASAKENGYIDILEAEVLLEWNKWLKLILRLMPLKI